MNHAPVELRAAPETLLALSHGITHFRVEHLQGCEGEVGAVWLQADRLFLVCADIVSLALKFEVFTLAVITPAEWLATAQANYPLMEKRWEEIQAGGVGLPSLPPPEDPAPKEELEDWPFRSWRLEVLRRMEFIVGPEHLPEGAETMVHYLKRVPPGEAPVGSDHSCLAAIGLLFTSDDGERLLIAADGMTGSMRVTDKEEDVRHYLRDCLVVPAADYLSALTGNAASRR